MYCRINIHIKRCLLIIIVFELGNLAMESTPNKIAMEKKGSGAEFEQQDKIKILRKKKHKI